MNCNFFTIQYKILRWLEKIVKKVKKEGKLEEKKKIATNMLKEKFSIDTIHKITRINKEMIETLQKDKS